MMKEIKKLFPLSFPQRDIWNTEKMYPGTSIGNVSGIYIFKGEIDYSILEQAINRFLKDNDGPRLQITERGGEFFQYVSEYTPQRFDLIDFSNNDQEKLFSYEEQQARILFSLLDSKLYYFSRIKLPGNQGGFYARFHHLISDGWSLVLCGNQVVEYYLQLKAGHEDDQTKPPSYLDFIHQKTEYMNSNRFKKDEEFWLERFQTAPEFTTLKDRGNSTPCIAAARKTVELSNQVTAEIFRYCAENKITPPAFFAAALLTYLYRLTSKHDLIIGNPVLNRVNAAEKVTAGMFVNVAPLRMTIDQSTHFATFALKVAAEWLNILKHQQYPYHLLLNKVRERFSPKENLYDILISYQNAKFEKNQTIAEPEYRWQFCGYQTNSFSLHINDRGSVGVFTLDYDYQTAVFSETEMVQLHHRFMRIIHSVLSKNTTCLAEIEILDETEKAKILTEFNNTAADYPRDKTLSQLFEAQVKKDPERIAVVFEGRKLSYRELNQRANHMAGRFREKGVKPGTIVGIMMERSLELITGILAILKAGGAILPIDPDYPAERVKYMLADSNPSVLLTQKNLAARIPWEKSLFWFDEESAFPEIVTDLENQNCSDDLLYIIYTSGTTGKPKGVMITHQNITNLLYYEFTKTKIDFSSRVLQYAAISFDVCYQEIFSTLLAGGELHLIKSEQRKDIDWLFHYIAANQIRVLFLPTAFFKLIFGADLSVAKFPSSVKHIIAAGEQLIVSAKAQELLKREHIYLHNHYGPSETHVVTTHTMAPQGVIPEVPPIGVPIHNTRIYILNENQNPQPIGVAGELYISGECVGKGYLNQPELTAEKFVPNPFVGGLDVGVFRESPPEEGQPQRLYRTGDLARWVPDGNLEFLGRIDHQVKIRGFRVEIGEIETCLLNYGLIKEAVVIAIEEDTGSKSLCAYIVADRSAGAQGLDLEQLRAYLAKKIPEYMIPSYFTPLEKMPVTPNGKIDRKRLPKPTKLMTEKFIAPEGATELKLARIWQDVLKVEKVSATARFFECGGDSLKAITMVSKIKQEFQVEIAIPQFFELKQFRELARYLSRQERSDYAAIKPVPLKEYYPLSPTQQRIFILQQFEGADAREISYNMPGVFRVEGPLDEARFEEAFQTLITRHEALRTSFEIIAGEPVQKIQSEVEFKFEKWDSAHDLKGGDSNPRIHSIMREFVRPFDLSKAPLIRVSLLRCSPNQFLLFFDMHHIISDGASLNILVQELFNIYDGKELPGLRIQYKDFAVRQNELLAEGVLKKQAEHWLNHFQGEIPVLNIPADYPRPAVQSYAGDRFRFKIEGQLFYELKNLMVNTDTTLYMILLAAYYTLLFRYSGQEDIIIGSPVAGRRHTDLQNIIGMFVNTLALRNYPQRMKTFREFLQEVKINGLAAIENQDYPFEELVKQLNLRRDLSRNPLFDTMFTLQNFDMAGIKSNGLRFQPLDYKNKIAKFDLTLSAVAAEDGIKFELEYSSKLFKKATVARLAGHITNILKAITVNPEIRLVKIEILTVSEKNQLLFDFNHTEVKYPKHKTIYELFEEQAARCPNQVAVVFDKNQLTYGELNAKSNSLAKILREKGVQPETIVAILTEPSLEMVIGILGILKAGGAYLPIDPGFPEERIKYILAETEAKILLTNDNSSASRETDLVLVNLEDQSLYQGPNANLNKVNQPNDLAYIIYTSGSTGRPKGVMVEHQGIANTIQWRRNEYQLSEKDNVLQLLSYIFDGFLTSLFTPLTSGAKIVFLNGQAVKDPLVIKAQIVSQQITHFIAVPPIFGGILDFIDDVAGKQLRIVTLAGDKVTSDLIAKCKAKLPRLEIINEYGPTENSVATTWLRNLQASSRITIGKPIANNQVYVVDVDGKIQPIGVSGELWISGAGLARGYLNHPELTVEKFISNLYIPGLDETPQRIYRTGDLARWTPDGNLEFLGRLDHQVKIRGFRIELGEIERQLLKSGLVKEAVVSVKNDSSGVDYLCAYFVAAQSLNSSEIRRYLAKQLPDYMIPSYFIRFDHLPLTLTGKIDQKALISSQWPEAGGIIDTGGSYVAPTDQTQEKLVRLWQEVLHIDKIGIDDNFFTLGGDSIRAIQVAAKASHYNLQLNTTDLFKYQTIAELAINSGHNHNEVAQVMVEGEVKFTPIQNMFFENIYTNRQCFCQMVMLQSRKELNETAIKQSFDKLIEHHDALRMIYPIKDGHMFQYNRGYEGKIFSFEQVDLTGALYFIPNMEKTAERLAQSIDFEKGPLVKLCLFKTVEVDYLLIVIHHLVIDGVSWRILLQDFVALYQQAENGAEISLPPKTSSYQEWAERLDTFASSEKLSEELNYWTKFDQLSETSSPRKDSVQKNRRQDSRTVIVHFSKEETQSIFLTRTRFLDVKVNEILLAALGIALKDLPSNEQLLINLEGHGREAIIDGIDLSRTIGWFTAVFPVVLDLSKTADQSGWVDHVKESLRSIPNHGIGYGILKYLTPKEKRGTMQFRLNPEINFNYLGQFDQGFAETNFSISTLPLSWKLSPNLERIESLEIIALVLGGELTVTFEYNQNQYERKMIEDMVKKFRAVLNELTNSLASSSLAGEFVQQL